MDDKFQRIAPLFIVAIWICSGLLYSNGLWTPLHTGWLLATHLICLLVFRNIVMVFSYGYALSCLGYGTFLLLQAKQPLAQLLALLCAVYGARLALFTWRRNRANSFASRMEQIDAASRRAPMFVKIILYVMTSWLFFNHAQSAYLVVSHGASGGLMVGAVVLMAVGLLVEGIADWQKQQCKSQQANTFCHRGLYKRIRHPNYSGEILFQIGLLLAINATGATLLLTISASIAPCYIALLMVFQAARHDQQQLEKYGNDGVYQHWRSRSGALLPF